MHTTATLARRYFDEVLSKGELAVADEILAPDLEFHGPNYWGEAIRGREAFKGFVTYLRSAFPDIRFQVGLEIGDDNWTATSFRFVATHRGEWMGIAPTGRPIDLPGLDLFRVERGRIQEIRVFYDTLGLLQQLGVVEAPRN